LSAIDTRFSLHLDVISYNLICFEVTVSGNLLPLSVDGYKVARKKIWKK